MAKHNSQTIRRKSISTFVFFSLVAAFLSLKANAQAPKPFVAHEVIEIGSGQKIEILKCRGEGPVEECDCIYYTDKRQNGKRMWQNADRIREEQRAAALEVAATKEQANQAAAALAASKAKEIAATKAARENEKTVSKETNEVIKTIKEQNQEIKTKGIVKANEKRRNAATTTIAKPIATQPNQTLSLQDAARRMDSLNKARTKPDESAVAADLQIDSVAVEKVYVPAPDNAKTSVTPKKETVTTIQHEAAKTKESNDSTIDFETLRKMEEDNNTVGGDVKMSATESKPATADSVKKTEETPVAPTSEQAPAPKPKSDENKINEDTTKEVTEVVPKTGDDVKTATDTTSSTIKPVEKKSKKKARKEKKKKEETTEEVSTATDTVAESPASTDTTVAQPAETPAKDSSANTDANNSSVETLKATMKEEISSGTNEEKPAAETAKKKTKKSKKEKKEKEIEAIAPPPPPVPSPVPAEPMTPLQKVAQVADSIRKANEKTDTATDESYKKPTEQPESKPQISPENNGHLNSASSIKGQTPEPMQRSLETATADTKEKENSLRIRTLQNPGSKKKQLRKMREA